MSSPLERGLSLNPITAVAFARTESKVLLLVGEGGQLRILDKTTSACLLSTRIFVNSVVHGIKCVVDPLPSDAEKYVLRCLIWGGRSIRRVDISFGKLGPDRGRRPTIGESEETILDDWILDVCLLHQQGSLQENEAPVKLDAVVLTYHNVLFSIHSRRNVCGSSEALHISVEPLAVGPSSVLYSGHVVNEENIDVLIAAGTVFGEVLLWSYPLQSPLSKPNGPSKRQLLYSFTGHEGSVFGIRISDIVSDPSCPRRLLASCSDDRTIRVWDIPSALEGSSTQGILISTASPGTGFGAPNPNQNLEQDRCLATAMGHQSRIWGLRFLPVSDNLTYLMSFGEDSTARLWRLRPSPPSSGSSSVTKPRSLELSNGYTYRHHIGKNIWSVDMIKAENDTVDILTGGADGRVISYSVDKSSFKSGGTQIRRWVTKPGWLEFGSIGESSPPAEARSDSSANSASLTRTVFAAMQGRWELHRTLTSKLKSYPSGRFSGTASLTIRPPTAKEYDAESVYVEEGDFATEQGITLKGSRTYVYRYQESPASITAWFVKGDKEASVDYLFHKVNINVWDEKRWQNDSDDTLRFTASGDHLCINDNYSAEYRFLLNDATLGTWNLKYNVTGPKKDYIADARYTRLPEPNLSPLVSPRKPEDSRTIHQSGKTDSKSDSFKAYCWISQGELLATTEQGRILLGNLDSENIRTGTTAEHYDVFNIPWTVVQKYDDLISCSIMTSVPGEITLITGKSGRIYRYHGSGTDVELVLDLPHKLSGLFVQDCIDVSGKEDCRRIGVVASCLGLNVAYCCFLERDKFSGPTPRDTVDFYNLELPPDFVVTSVCFNNMEDLVVLGSRSGALCFYDQADFVSSGNVKCCQCIRHVHGEDAVTAIRTLPNATLGSLLTTARDGKFAIHRFQKRLGSAHLGIEMWTSHMSEPPFGPNIESACFDRRTRDLMLWGFRSTEFVVWNETKQMEVIKVECGGAHRSWAFAPGRDGVEGGSLVWTKASMCNIQVQPRASHRLHKSGGHGREIKALAISPCVFCVNGASHRLLATGAEDTLIRLSYHDSRAQSKDGFKTLATISKHTTGIQQLQWLPEGRFIKERFLISAGGREELFVWRVAETSSFGIGVTCEVQCQPVTKSMDLRVMDVDVAEIADSEHSDFYSSFLINVVYSDSSVRVWLFDPSIRDQQKLTLLFTGTYCACCLTRIQHFFTRDELYLVTAGTDGYVAFWPMREFLTSRGIRCDHGLSFSAALELDSKEQAIHWNKRHQIHQSSIKCMIKVLHMADDHVIATSGDDNAIAFTKILVSKDGGAPDCLTLLIPRAHASTVTAIQVAEQPYGVLPTTIVIATASNDQKLRSWILTYGFGSGGMSDLNVARGEELYSSVADVSCMDILPEDENGKRAVVLAGIGVETWTLKNE